MCEVLSPSTGRHDLTRKRDLYGVSGVAFLGLVDRSARTLEAFERRDGAWTLLTAFAKDGRISVPPLDSIAFDLAALWPPEPEDAAPSGSTSTRPAQAPCRRRSRPPCAAPRPRSPRAPRVGERGQVWHGPANAAVARGSRSMSTPNGAAVSPRRRPTAWAVAATGAGFNESREGPAVLVAEHHRLHVGRLERQQVHAGSGRDGAQATLGAGKRAQAQHGSHRPGFAEQGAEAARGRDVSAFGTGSIRPKLGA